jgi:hypothetical protein
LEQVEMTAAAAVVGEPEAADELHALLCALPAESRAVWALVPSFKQAVLDGFVAAEGPSSARYAAWREVMRVDVSEPESTTEAERQRARPVTAPPPPAPAPPQQAVAPPTNVGDTAATAAAGANVTPPPAASTPASPRGRRQPTPTNGGPPSSQADVEAPVDLLGRGPMVSILASMLDDEQQGTPFTFALFGSWGAGKSSVLRQLQDQLERTDTRHKFCIARFNAWAYEKTDNVAAGLVQETVAAIVPRPVRWGRMRRFGFRIHYGLSAHATRVVGLVVVLLASLAAATYGLITGTKDDSIAKIVLGTGGLTVFGLIGATAVRLYRHPVSTELLTYFRLPDYKGQVGLLRAMRDELEALWTLEPLRWFRKRRPRRLVIFVDDLDRCSPPAITATFDAIRLVVDLAGAVVIVALDERIGLRAVAHEYKEFATADRDDEDIARDFLAKIVQLSIRIGPPDGIERYVRQELFNEQSTAPADATSKSAPAHAEPAAASSPEFREPPAASTVAAPTQAAADSPAFVGGASAPSPYYSSSAPAPSTVVLREAMRETRDEVDEFVRLVVSAGFTNPRQLRRLRNSYRFAKALSPTLDWQPLLVALLWQELLHTLPAAQHRRYLGRPVSVVDLTDLGGIPPEFQSLVADAFETDDDFSRYRDAVLLTVLPRLEIADHAPPAIDPTTKTTNDDATVEGPVEVAVDRLT